jgi:periplasmic protein TonB
MTTLAVGPRITTETAVPRRRRARVMLMALAISLLVHAAVAAVLLWPAAGPRDEAGEGAALVVEIVGAAPQPEADTPAAATPLAAQDVTAAEIVAESPAAQPAAVAAPMARPEPAPIVEAAIEIERIAALAAIKPAAGPPLEAGPGETEPAEFAPEIPTASLVALTLPTSTAKLPPAAALAEPPAASAAAPTLDGSSAPAIAAAAPAISGSPAVAPVPAVGTTSGASLSVAHAEPGTAATGAAPGMDSAPLFDVAGLDNPWPDYPRLARRRGQEGEALLAVTVLADGAPSAVELRTSSGYALLDEAALEAVRRWRFLPALVAGQPVQGVVNVPVVFRLE